MHIAIHDEDGALVCVAEWAEVVALNGFEPAHVAELERQFTRFNIAHVGGGVAPLFVLVRVPETAPGTAAGRAA